jgi:hypothetical protein
MIAFDSDRSGNRDIWVIQVGSSAVEESSWGAVKAMYRQSPE